MGERFKHDRAMSRHWINREDKDSWRDYWSIDEYGQSFHNGDQTYYSNIRDNYYKFGTSTW